MGSSLAGAPHLLLSVLPPDRLQDSLPSEEVTTNMRRMGAFFPLQSLRGSFYKLACFPWVKQDGRRSGSLVPRM